MARKLVVEAIGTFFLMLTVGQTVVAPGAGSLAPLAIGSALMIMVYAGGPISGGHYNPAVSLGVFLRGKLTGAGLAGYWTAQVIGAFLAALAVHYMKGGAAPSAMSLHTGPALLAEFLFTFALVFVVLTTATAPATEGNSYFGLAIGFTIMVGAYAVGNVSGGAFNPAVALGITALGLSSWSAIWIFLVAELVGGTVAAIVFNVLGLGAEATVVEVVAEL